MVRRTIVGVALAGVLLTGGVATAVVLASDDATTPTPTAAPATPATPGGYGTPQPAPCTVDYVVRDEWPGGFTVDVTLHNTRAALDGWTLAWRFDSDARVEEMWGATLLEPEPGERSRDVLVRDVDYTAAIGAGGSVGFGFVGSGTPGPTPAEFRLGDLTCSVGPAPGATVGPGANPPSHGLAAGDSPFFVNPGTRAAAAAASASGEAKGLLDRIAQTPQAFWVTDQDPVAAAAAVADYTGRAEQAGAIGVLVLYAIPGRDCGYHSAGGVADSEYARWVDAVAHAVVGEPWVVLEPDALAMLGDCDGQGDRVGYLRYAATALTGAGARVYVDAGHSGWHGAEETARRLNEVGLDGLAGFALNTSNYQTTADSVAYGERVSELTGGASYVIDVSRNGNGSNGEWCNPRGRALGEAPRLVDDGTHLDALLWVKLPGESDGPCNGGPAAGEWFEEIALELARNAG